ncbi:metallophosphoesterase [Fibrisoma montanum]|uniref:Metallophosphoesterase n=1 Tax=Fibrisoma montanum TaxID=2305895 RepID=A0A418LX24_9BACT|nr:metallophosphoesterase [Fibrisoma montanum]RIV17862.1 metallophosphoesterase [Fibrisoma montanum]
MRVAFITDLHIGAEGEKPMDVDVRQNFLNALAFLPEVNPACLVIGGDICYQTGDRTIYQWVRQQVSRLRFPCYYIAGNHDDSTLLAEEMNLTHNLQDGELYYALPLEGYPSLFLDTSRGTMSPTQWEWLREHLLVLKDNNVLVFMHHPPVEADVRYMDTTYPFQQGDQFLSLVKELPCHVTVVCGHYHVEKTVLRGNLTELITPSLFFQMKHDPAHDAVIDHYRIAVRELNLTSHGTNSTVHYL